MGIKSQFKCKYFGFGCSDDERDLFFRTQYSKCRGYYMAYRCFMWMYQFGWFLAYYIHHARYNGSSILRLGYRFLTRWGYIVNVVYFTLAFIYSIIGYVKRNEQLIYRESKPMLVFRSTIWLLHSIGQTGAIIIVVLFWGIVYSPKTFIMSALLFDAHGTNLILYVIEIFVVAFPMRLLHVIYPVMFGSLYVIATVIMHAVGDVSAIYTALDWKKSPGRAAGLGVAAAIGGGIVGHLIMFLLYRLRIFIARQCNPSTAPGVELRSSVNPAYEIDSK